MQSKANYLLSFSQAEPAFFLCRSEERRLLKDAVASFTTNCVRGIEPDEERLRRYAERSLMNVTALTLLIGYDRAAQAARRAHDEGTTLKEAVLALGWMDEAAFDRAVDLEKLCFPHDTPNG